MKKESLSSRIKVYMKRNGGWVNGGELERLAMGVGYKASNASRRCREMESGTLSNGKTCPIVLEKKEDEKGTVWYRYKTAYETKQVPVVVEKDGVRVAVMQDKLFEIK